MNVRFLSLSLLLSVALMAQSPPTPPTPENPPPPAAPAESAKPAPPAAPAPAAQPQDAPAPAPPAAVPAPTTEASPSENAKPTPVATPRVSDKAILLFYRESRFVGAALRPSLFVDDVEVAYISSGSYLKVAVSPGDHVIYADEKGDALTFPTEAGKTYYFRVGIRAGIFKGHGKIEPVSEEAGSKEFEAWKPKLTYTAKILKPDMVVMD